MLYIFMVSYLHEWLLGSFFLFVPINSENARVPNLSSCSVEHICDRKLEDVVIHVLAR